MALERKPTGAYDAAFPVPLPDGRTSYLGGAIVVDQAGNPLQVGSKQETLNLANNSVSAGPQTAFGGDYQIRAVASNWNGGSAKIQFLDADGSTYTDLTNQDGSAVTPFTANRTQPTGLGSNAIIKAVITGSPVGLFIVASRMP